MAVPWLPVIRYTLALFVALLGAGCEAAAPLDVGPDAEDLPACTEDGDCDDEAFCTGIEQCIAGRCATRPSCAAGQICDEANDRCFTDCAVEEDADADGSRARECGGLDCDDNDPDRAPGLVEVCDATSHDEDCDPTTYGFRDLDGDDFVDAVCCNLDPIDGRPLCGDDCDDMRRGVNPSVPELCNALDDDCDGATDEALLNTVYRDADFDGHGTETRMDGDVRIVCDVEPGWSRTSDDCDDTNPVRFRGNPEVCDAGMQDEDCSGVPNDPEGGCECVGSGSEACGTLGVCAGARRQCVDGTFTACERVPGVEVCDGSLDEDCDGRVDETLTVRCFRDNDNDGYAPDGAVAMDACPSSDPARMGAPWNRCPAGTTGRMPGPSAVDCCDSDSRARPGATGFQTSPRACGGFDFDCDGSLTRQYGTSEESCNTNCNFNGDGWCDPAPACGGTAGRSTGCFAHGVGYCTPSSCPLPNCYPVSCWPTTMGCR